MFLSDNQRRRALRAVDHLSAFARGDEVRDALVREGVALSRHDADSVLDQLERDKHVDGDARFGVDLTRSGKSAMRGY